MRRKLLLALAALCVLYVGALSACTSLAHHTAAPYDRDPQAAAAIERRAADWCAEHEHPGGMPPRPFRFDGCSFWPDGLGDSDWRHCCEAHDFAYWCGGSAADRARADAALGQCVAAETNPAFGWLMRTGVRAGGHPVVPMYFRWGYGFPYAGGYPEPR